MKIRRARSSMMIALAVASALVGSPAEPAGAIVYIPGQLSDVACPTTTACIAVGYTDDRVNPTGALAMSWNGSSWHRTTFPAPDGSLNVALSGVSCTASNACVAVGWQQQDSSGETFAMAASWNGVSWTLQTTPVIAGRRLYAISCTTATACTAVGSKGGDFIEHPLAMRWNGSSWSAQALPTVPDGTVLHAVSCATATSCSAVANGSPIKIVFHWDGSAWSKQATARPPINSNNLTWTFSNVLCRAADRCVAVGHYSWETSPQARYTYPLVERWNGTAWTFQQAPTVNNAYNLDVACPSSTACTAVGTAYTDVTHNVATPFALRWNGSTWASQAVGGPSFKYNALNGVACPAVLKCFAVGVADAFILIERWKPTGWARQR